MAPVAPMLVRKETIVSNTVMTNNPNELTIENSVLVLIDHQPAVAFNVHSIDLGLLVNNVAALSQVAKALGVPTVLTTVGAQGSVLVDPIFKEITDAFPDITANRPPLVARLVTPGRAGCGRGDGPQEAGHGRPRDRGLPRPVGTRSSQGRVRRLLRQ